MPSYTRMKRIFLEGLLWLFLLQYGLTALSLEPGFLDFDNLPDTNFTCVGKVIGGYYADLETNCQMFHVCTIGQADEPMDIRFLCLNGTVFDQETRVCERIDEVDCSKSEQFYSLNLELYGNSGPILEETPEVPQETETPSIIIKSTTSTTTTTTTTKRPTNKPQNAHYYTTIRPATATTLVNKLQPPQGHHFPVNTPDIRFNPEEINISLNPGAPPDIRTKHFQPHSLFSDSSKFLLSDNDEEQSVRVQKPERLRVSSSSASPPKSIYALEASDSDKLPQNSDDTLDFLGEDFHSTELPRQQQFLIQTNSFRHSQSFPPNVNHNSNQYHHPQFHSTTIKQPNDYNEEPSSDTTFRTIYLHSLKPPQVHTHHHYTHHPRTEKTPQRVQIPIPLLPTLPPLTFSSPAPFTLQRHIETKRYTKDHQAPPRIIISASASVSDASGRRLNYSLGTIGAAQILESPPSSYDEYKDSDVGLDPFYHDVPKIKQRRRRKRDLEEKEKQINPFDIIKNEKEAVEVLKFLYTWYQSHQATATVPSVTSPVSPDLIRKINNELAPSLEDSTLRTDSSEYHYTNSKEPSSTESLKPEYAKSDLFKENGRYSIIGGYRNENPRQQKDNEEDKLAKNYDFDLKNEEEAAKLKSSNLTKDPEHKALEEPTRDVEITSLESYKENNTISSLSKTNLNHANELKEKMDNIDDTVLKDTKDYTFNPDDYVDDNYEGVVYKEHADNIAKELVKNVDLKEENISTSPKYVSKENRFVDPIGVSELYKYFIVNNQLTTQPPPEFSSTQINDQAKSDDKSLSSESDGNVTKEFPALDNSKKDLQGNKYQLDNSTDRINDTGRYTEINVLSEVNEPVEIIQNSSSTSTTTTTVAPVKHTVRRRGRGRQRQVDSYHEASYKSSVSKANINDVQNVISSEPNGPWKSTSGRGRNRGRSRFSQPHSSSTTTHTTTSTTTSTTTTSVPDDSYTTFFEEFTTLPTVTEMETPPNIFSEIPIAIQENVDELFLNDSSHTFNSNSYNVTEKNQGNNDKNILGNITKSEETHINTSELLIDIDINVETDNQTILNATTINSTEKEGLTETQVHLNTSIDEHVLTDQESTNSSFEGGSVKTISDNEINGIINTVSVEAVTESLLTNYTNKDDPVSEKETPVSTNDDPTYLIKLLRYFAESAKTEPLTTEVPDVFYAPLTESQVTSTQYSVTPAYNQDSTTELRKHRQRSRYRHSSRVSTTELPTLKDVYESTRPAEEAKHEVKENYDKKDDDRSRSSNSNDELEEVNHVKSKADLLEKLSVIEQNLAADKLTTLPVTNSPIADTTVTTPIVSFEEHDSFGTTFTSATEPTKYAEYSTATQELTEMFKITTAPTIFTSAHNLRVNNKSFYDDLFVVPELTEKSTQFEGQEKASVYEVTTKLLDNTPEISKKSEDLLDDTYTKSYETTNNADAEIPTTTDTSERSSSKSTIIVEDVTEPLNIHEAEETTTHLPDVEIQKSISLPISVLQTSFDTPYDVNQAQDINGLLSTTTVDDDDSKTTNLDTPSTLPSTFLTEEKTTEKTTYYTHSTELYGNTSAEIIPATIATTENPMKEHNNMKAYPSLEEPEVQHNATEIIFLKKTPALDDENLNLPDPASSKPLMETPGMVNSSHLLQVVVESTTNEPTTILSTSTKAPYHTRKTRPPRRRPYKNEQFGRHRFSTELFTNKPPRGDQGRNIKQGPKENITDAPLHRSAIPTRSELKKVALHTTPLSSRNRAPTPVKVSKHYVFNCFGKDINRFYADPRDCRLFHYCTQGYSKNQLLDLKYVCDHKTFFDEDKLTCTKVKPVRCL